jgi:hypothetical protein
VNTLLKQKIKEPAEQVFLLLWSVAMFCHYEWWTLTYDLNQPFLGAATTLLLAPLAIVSLNRLVFSCLLFAQLIDVYQAMPAIPNHWLLSGVIDFFYLAWVFQHYLKKAPFAVFQNALKWILISFYLWAAFWKSNSGFLDAQKSCATVFMLEVPLFSLMAPKNLLWLVPYKVLIAEALIPVLLLTKHLLAAVVLGVLFHLGLAQNIERIFVNFSSVMVAGLVVASISPAAAAKLCLSAREDRALVGIGLLAFVAVIWCSGDPLVANLVLRYLFWTALAIYILIFSLKHRAVFETFPTRLTGLAYAAIAVVSLNGIAPYLGTKTGSAWQMYSNLYIDAERSNHTLVSSSLDLHGHLKEKVQARFLGESKAPAITREAVLHTIMQECAIEGCEGLHEVVKQDGGVISAEQLRQQSAAMSWANRKVVRYLDLDSETNCRW